MLDYLFDPDYREAKNKFNDAKGKQNKLQKIKENLTNDSSSVNVINNRLDYIYSDFSAAVGVSDVKSRVSSKLSVLKEPGQWSDSYISAACDCIDAELGTVRTEMENAETAMETSIEESRKRG